MSSGGKKDVFYAGETLDLKERFEVQFRRERKNAWPQGELKVQYFTAEANFADLIAYQSLLVGRYKPRLNSESLAAV